MRCIADLSLVASNAETQSLCCCSTAWQNPTSASCAADDAHMPNYSPDVSTKAEDISAMQHTSPHYPMHASDEEILESPDLKHDHLPGFAYPAKEEEDGSSVAGLPVKQEDHGQVPNGHGPSLEGQHKLPIGSWYDPQVIKTDEEEDLVVIKDDLLDDIDDDEPVIIKVETAGEKERQTAAEAQQEIGRLQREQLQTKFDHAAHRKDQVSRNHPI